MVLKSKMNPSTKRWEKILGMSVAVASTIATAGCSSSPIAVANPNIIPDSPNVLFLFTDDQTFDALGCMGNEVVQTPNLDLLAKEGALFTQAHIRGGICGAVCMPSRAQMLTGRDLYEIKGEGGYIPEEHITLPETFLQSGYETFGTGKWHSGKESFARSFFNGENIFFGGMGDQFAMPLHSFDPRGKYSRSPDRRTKEHATELFADSAINFIENYQSERPFFAYVSFTSPHDPRTAPKEYHDRYPVVDMPIPPDFMPNPPYDTGELEIRDELLDVFPRTEANFQKHLATYYAMITQIDDKIGQLINALKKSGVYENTIIVFSSDNGLSIGGRHGLMGKQHLYDESIRVPLILAGPGIPKGIKSENRCYLQDLFPTLCALIGIELPPSVTFGKSLLPIFSDPNYQLREEMVFGYKTYMRAIKKDEWKLIAYNVNQIQSYQLFNLEDDPYEINDLANKEEFSEIQSNLITLLKEQMKAGGDMCDMDQPHWGFPNPVTWNEALSFFP